jgi:hypothetical protein
MFRNIRTPRQAARCLLAQRASRQRRWALRRAACVSVYTVERVSASGTSSAGSR